MKQLQIWLILLLKLAYIHITASCDVFQTKRTCECSVLYTLNDEVEKFLFDLPSYDDCGVNLGCERLDCNVKCLNAARKVIGGEEDFLSLLGRNKICQLVNANLNRPLDAQITGTSGIKLWAKWKYSTCRQGLEPIIQNVCCNRKCECKIKSQDVTSLDTTSNLVELRDLKDYFSPKDIFYECLKPVEELNQCDNECLTAASLYYNNNLLKTPNNKKLNLNLFENDQAASETTCNLIGEAKIKPGADVYLEIDASGGTNEELKKRMRTLGRVCCKQECTCEYNFRNGITGDQVPANSTLTKSEAFKINSYECANELAICMSSCRKYAMRTIIAFDPTFDKNLTTPENDPFQIKDFFTYRQEICKILNIDDKDNNDKTIGYNVYMRYAVNSNELFPLREDIHIGRLCCKRTLGQFLGFNRCDFS